MPTIDPLRNFAAMARVLAVQPDRQSTLQAIAEEAARLIEPAQDAAVTVQRG